MMNSRPTRVALELHTIDKLVLITVHALPIVIRTQMSAMPEASSALFMSQFSDEAVRDAIARVSSAFIPFTLQATPKHCKERDALLFYLLRAGEDLHKLKDMFIQAMLCA